jgi:uncharacterized protein YndB with AHSA1/START domain
MHDIRHRVGVFAPQDKVFAAFADAAGVAQWWTDDVRGDGGKGGKLAFYFGGDEAAATMRVTELVPDERVVWEVLDGPAEWVGTTIAFDVYPGPGEQETVVKFTHAGWREPVEFMHHCSTRWAQFLLGLKDGAETGAWRPYPAMPTISSWR